MFNAWSSYCIIYLMIMMNHACLMNGSLAYSPLIFKIMIKYNIYAKQIVNNTTI